MAKIVKKLPSDKYRIKYVPKGYGLLYPKSRYRHMTVIGKELADKTVKELTAIEKIDLNEQKLGITDIPSFARELTIGKLFSWYKQEVMPYQNYADGTIKRYTNLMNTLINDLGKDYYFKDIDYKLIIQMYDSGNRNPGVSKCRCLNSIGNSGRRAIDENELVGMISSKPIKFPKVIRSRKNALSLEQLQTIYNHPEIDSVTKDLIRLYVITGCRRSELCRPYFKWSQIDEANGVAFIKNKGNKKKHDTLLEIPWLKQHKEIIGRLHAHYKGWHELADIYPIPITKQNVYERMVIASKKSGITFTPHDLRDTGATLILRATGNIYAAKEFCGHSSVRDTELAYAEWIMDDKKKATGSLIESMGSLL